MDGIKPQHLKDLVGKETGEHGDKVLESLSSFSDFCLNGKVPLYVTHFLYGATLCGLNKTDNSIRPIAIGNTLRRLVSRIASSRVVERKGDALRPKQLGFGTRGGCEAGVHAARHFVNFPHATTKVFVKLDFRNSYNEIERQPFLKATKEKCPEIYPFIHQCYSEPTWLTFGDFGMLSQRGCQQGDPCGPALFCLGINNMVVSLASEFNIWTTDRLAEAPVARRPSIRYKRISRHRFAIKLLEMRNQDFGRPQPWCPKPNLRKLQPNRPWNHWSTPGHWIIGCSIDNSWHKNGT